MHTADPSFFEYDDDISELTRSIEHAYISLNGLLDIHRCIHAPKPIEPQLALEAITAIYHDVGIEGYIPNIGGAVASIIKGIKAIINAIMLAWRRVIDWIFDSWNKAKVLVLSHESTILRLIEQINKGVYNNPKTPTIYNEKIYDCFYCSDKTITEGAFERVGYLTSSIDTIIKMMSVFVDTFNKLLTRANEMKRMIGTGQPIDESGMSFQGSSIDLIVKNIGTAMQKYKNKNSTATVAQYGPAGNKASISIPISAKASSPTVQPILAATDIAVLTKSQMLNLLSLSLTLSKELDRYLKAQSGIRSVSTFFTDTIKALNNIADSLHGGSNEQVAAIRAEFTKIQEELYATNITFNDFYRKTPSDVMTTLSMVILYVQESMKAYSDIK